MDAVINTAKKFMPRGFREEYIPGWSDKSDDLFKHLLISNTCAGEQERVKIVEILKSGNPQSYRPNVLSMMYKLHERLIYNRISSAQAKYSYELPHRSTVQ